MSLSGLGLRFRDSLTFFSFINPPVVEPTAVLYRSADGGNTWEKLVVGGDGSSGTSPIAFNSKGDVFAIAHGSVLVSRDSGDTWESFTEFKSARRIATNAQDELFVLVQATLYRSVDDGTTWTRVLLGSGVNVVYIAPDGSIWVGSSHGLNVSDDNGDTWRRVDTRFRDIRAVLVDQRGAIYCGLFEDGIIRSVNGVDWAQVGLRREVSAIVVDSQGNIYMDSYVSTDNGVSWSTTSGPIPGAVNSRGHVFSISDGSVHLSTDHSQTWTEKRSFRSIYAIAIDAQGRIFVLATTNSGPRTTKLFHSTDDGDSWQALRSFDDARLLFATNDARIFVGARDGLYRSTDGGENWLPIWPDNGQPPKPRGLNRERRTDSRHV